MKQGFLHHQRRIIILTATDPPCPKSSCKPNGQNPSLLTTHGKEATDPWAHPLTRIPMLPYYRISILICGGGGQGTRIGSSPQGIRGCNRISAAFRKGRAIWNKL
ncbi:hypothetical protein CDAR_307171 [Caerostris darwini]|uniref:Uncharacterized protein n=1 Tax=Caerostris darwini TaxID=1538125 RepID=A0AAV4NYG2_9ARAC|nr:hypothetical protein CDAR_307171 [Caerostris darwini]